MLNLSTTLAVDINLKKRSDTIDQSLTYEPTVLPKYVLNNFTDTFIHWYRCPNKNPNETQSPQGLQN